MHPRNEQWKRFSGTWDTNMLEAVPLIPMHPVLAAAQTRGRERLQLIKLAVIMQEQPLPQPPNTIHNVACKCKCKCKYFTSHIHIGL